MKLYLPLCLVVLAGCQPPNVVSCQRIWSNDTHCAFTDLCRHQGVWLGCLREGSSHNSLDGRIRVIRSVDGATWASAALIAIAGQDLRDPKLAIAPNGQLMLTTGPRSAVTYSQDGLTWGPLQPMQGPAGWLWRPSWSAGLAEGASYGGTAGTIILWRSVDGLAWSDPQPIALDGSPGEATFRWVATPAGPRHLGLVRREGGDRRAAVLAWNATAGHWDRREAPWHMGGPNMLQVPNGRVYAAARVTGPPHRTVVARVLDDLTLRHVATLPSGGDTGYPGMAWWDGLLWVSYYSEHEGQAAVYLARVQL